MYLLVIFLSIQMDFIKLRRAVFFFKEDMMHMVFSIKQ